MCRTGEYTERGIKAYDGFMTQYVVDQEKYFIKIPPQLVSVGVLTEPLSVAEKAIEEALAIQTARFPFKDTTTWFSGKCVLVAGVGAVGLLAAFALRLRGAMVLGLDIVPEDSIRPSILKEIGGVYIDGRNTNVADIEKKYGQIDFIFEAAGISKLQFDLIDALGINGIYAVTGIPAGMRTSCISSDELMRQVVLKNQIVLGSVNAGVKHYELAVQTLLGAKHTWGSAIERVITDTFSHENFMDALSQQGSDSIKTIITW
jgi:threonine dehydrogenase-like Zn-dependent dehydrogenase